MGVDFDAFRDVLRHFASGVTIVTLKDEHRIHGLTVSSFASVSADPPLVAVIIDRRHSAFPMLDRDGAVFAVNILREEQQELSDRFAWVKEEDRFAEGEWGTAATGAPVLADALAWLDCRVHARHVSGSHVIVVGEVEAAGVPHPESAPLVYWNRAYRRIEPL